MNDSTSSSINDKIFICSMNHPNLPTGDEERYLEAAEELRALDIIPNDLPNDSRFPEHYNRISPKDRIAAILVDAGSYLVECRREYEALPFLERAIEIEPDDIDAHRELGVVYGVINKPAEALAHFSEMIRIDPNNAEGYCGRGDCYLFMEDPAKAISSYKDAYRVDPENPAVMQRLTRLRMMGFDV